MEDNITFRYVYSGSLTNKMHDMLVSLPKFIPLDILVSQADKNGLYQAIEWKRDGFCRFLICDSGAFGVHTGKFETDEDSYAEFIKKTNDDIDIFAQLDKIPGRYQYPKKPEDYIESAEKSWDSFLTLRSKVPNPEKVIPVSHFGEDLKYFKRMLEWKDEKGNHLDYIGLSPANDASKEERMIYLRNMYDVIKKSSNPNVKTHIFGFTALDAIKLYPMYSADSVSHRLWAAYNKILSRNFGIISMSKKPRTVKNKSSLSFLETADEYNLNVLKSELEDMGINKEFLKKFDYETDDVFEALSEDNNLRVVVNIMNVQYLVSHDYKYKPDNLVRPKKLF